MAQQPHDDAHAGEHENTGNLSRREFLKASATLIAGGVASLADGVEAQDGDGAKSVLSTLESFRTDPLETWVLGTNVFVVGSRGALRIAALDHRDNTPVAGATVRITAQKSGGEWVALFDGRTDERGTVTADFEVPMWGLDRNQLHIEVASPIGTDRLTAPITLVGTRQQVLLTTDKPLYQPGQTIHLRALAMQRPSQTPLADQPLTFEISDPKGNVLLREETTTSRFGTAATTFALGNEINLGEYTLRVAVGLVAETKKVKVDRYELPKWKIEVSTDQKSFASNETLRGTVEARYFFGKPVASADVLMRLSSGNPTKEWAQIKGRTDKNGLWKWEAPPSGSSEASTARLEVAVTDVTEHTQIATHAVPIAAGAIVVTVLPDSTGLAPHLENRLWVLTHYPDGTPATCRFILNVQNVQLEGVTDGAGIGEVRFVPTTGGVRENPQRFQWSHHGARTEWRHVPPLLLSVGITARDEHGNSVNTAHNVELWNPDQGLLVRPQRSLARSGETLRVEVLCSANSRTAYLDVLKEKQLVRTHSLPLLDGRGEIEVPLEGDVFGTLQLYAYTLLPGNMLGAQDAAIVQVQKADDLHVAVSAAHNQSTWKPGEAANLQLRVTDGRGQPAVAALGVQIVDEAVFALQEMRPGEERVYFALARELVQPQIAGLSVHDVFLPERAAQRDIDRQRVARVLFAAARPRVEFGINTNSYPAKFETTRYRQLNYLTNLVIKDAIRIGAAVEAYRKKTKQFPGVAEARHVLLEAGLLTADDWKDPFGNEYAIRSRNGLRGMRTFVLVSAGVDGQMNSSDDIAVIGYSGGGAEAFFEPGQFRGASVGTGMMAPPAVFNAAPPRSTQPTPPGIEPIRVRQFFPETLWVHPNVLTDDNGQASLSVPMADSITTWRLNALASSERGGLGSATTPLRVFQDFFVDVTPPSGLMQNDEITIPVGVYNYLPQAQTVRLQLEDPNGARGAWFEMVNDTVAKAVTVGANEVGMAHFRVKAQRSGSQKLRVTARGTRLADAIERGMDVLPDGRPIWQSSHDRLQANVSKTIVIPRRAIEGAEFLSVRIHPGGFSQAAEGIDKILRMPTGCFEQSASATYPNVLALDFLKKSRRLNPEIVAKAEAYNNAGYQKVLTYEVPGGGFSLYGRSPASLSLTAYGLLMLSDMSRVRLVDSSLIARAQKWLATQQKRDGSWNDDLRVTAFVAWALAASGDKSVALANASKYLEAHWQTVRDAYTLAKVANAVVTIDPSSELSQRVLEALAEMARVDVGTAFWPTSQPTWVGAKNTQADIETTGLATYALLRGDKVLSSRHQPLVFKALTFLAQKKDAHGTWGSTQATICALRALLWGTSETELKVQGEAVVLCNRRTLATFQLTPQNTGTLFQVDAKDALRKGDNTLEIRWNGSGEAFYSISSQYHLPWAEQPALSSDLNSLHISVDYDRTQLVPDEMATCRVLIENRSKQKAEMVVAVLGVAPGFEAQIADLVELTSTSEKPGIIERMEKKEREIIVYFNDFAPGQKTEFSYRLQARFPLRAKTPPSVVYEYYTPQIRGESRPLWLQVKPARIDAAIKVI